MKCDRTPSERIIDLTQTGHPNAVKVAVLRFVAGVHKRRNVPVTRGKIVEWLRRTPPEAIDAALMSLLGEGKVRLCGKNKYAATLSGMPAGYRLPSDMSGS